MTPLYFGESSRRLFGAYTPARATGGKQRGVVLCPPWGPEYLRSHRSMGQLAKLLAEAGFHALRFDYFGTGDSAGDMVDADLHGWQSDVEMAVDELKDTTGLNRVTLLGLRVGGTLAARAASRRPRDVDALVLWDPIVHGGDHMNELQQQNDLVCTGLDDTGKEAEMLGFPMSQTMARELRDIALWEDVTAWPTRTLITVCEELPSHGRLRMALEASQHGPVDMGLIECLPAWLEDRHSGAGAVPVKQLERIVEWLS
jgi:uncharacterized protein